MRRALTVILIIDFFALLFSCGPSTSVDYLAIESQVIQVEKDFSQMAKEEGLEKAFLYFAAEDAVISRDRRVYQGKDAIQAYFSAQNTEDVKLDWSPEFVKVAKAGDLAYTYGPFTFEAKDSSGPLSSKGIFHTIWEKQKDGSWKYVWD